MKNTIKKCDNPRNINCLMEKYRIIIFKAVHSNAKRLKHIIFTYSLVINIHLQSYVNKQ